MRWILCLSVTFADDDERGKIKSVYYNETPVFSLFIPAPTKPENLTSRGITGTTIELSWSEPENANGVIAGYRVYYMHSNYTDVKMHIPDKSADADDTYIEFMLKELRKYTSCIKDTIDANKIT